MHSELIERYFYSPSYFCSIKIASTFLKLKQIDYVLHLIMEKVHLSTKSVFSKKAVVYYAFS